MQHAHHRKLTAVYDALDARQYKAAVKAANALLSKFPGDQLGMVLKALALHNVNKQQEAHQLLEDVLQQQPTDSQVLQTLCSVCKAMGCTDALPPLYEAAVKANPQDATLLKGLFTAHVRARDYVKQQAAARALFRLAGGAATSATSPASLYMGWVAASVALQARSALRGGPSALPAQTLLSLCESLLAKAPGVLASYEGLLLYIDTLCALGKHADVVAVLQGPLGAAVPLERDRQWLWGVATCLLDDSSQQLPVAAQPMGAGDDDSWLFVLRDLYLHHPWSRGVGSHPGMEPYVISGGLAQAAGVGFSVPALDAAAVNAGVDALLQQLAVWRQEDGAGLGAAEARRRMAFVGSATQPATAPLGVVEALHRALHASMAVGCSGQRKEHLEQLLADEVLAVFARCGRLNSYAADVRWYVSRLTSPHVRQGLAAALHAACDGMDGVSQAQVLRCRVNAHVIAADLGVPEHADRASSMAHVRCLLSLYTATLDAAPGLDKHESGLGDDLITLAAAALVGTAGPQDSSGADKTLIMALLLVESACQHRPTSASHRLAATALASLLGCPGTAAHHYAALEGELTQGLVLTNTGRGMPPLSLPSLLQQTKALHVDHQRDGPDLLMIAYDRGTLSKVIEFVDFDERLERSYVRAACQVEHALLQMRTALLGGAPLATAAAAAAAQAAAVVERVSPLAACTFNEDWSTRPSWLPPATEGAAWALLQWWDTQDSCLGQALGIGRCWWSSTTAKPPPNSPHITSAHSRQHAALIARARVAALLAGCTQPAGNGDDQSLADEASTLSVGREDSGSSGNVVKDGWRLLCESSGEGLRALEIEEQRFACWAAHDATVQAVAGYTPSTSLVAAHTDMLVHLAAAAACWKRTSLATGSTRATITWLCGLAASVQRWSVRMQSAPVWLAGWADSPTLLSVAQWARDEALWIVHALHQWRGEGAGGAVQQALLDVEEVVSKALHAVRAVVAPQGAVEEVVAGLQSALQSDWESLGPSLASLPTQGVLRALVVSQQGVRRDTVELLNSHLACLGRRNKS